jgi:hypothetical protein
MPGIDNSATGGDDREEHESLDSEWSGASPSPKISKSVKKTASMFGALTSHWAKPEVLEHFDVPWITVETGLYPGFWDESSRSFGAPVSQ